MPWKTILTLASLLALLRVPDYIPSFSTYKVFDWDNIRLAFDFVPVQAAEEAAAMETLRPDVENLDGAPARRLYGTPDAFFENLRHLENGENRVVRVLHYGDSPVTADMITADVRDLLQKRFGDAGHGYHLMAAPWEWYAHRGVSVYAEGWQIDSATQGTIRDGLFGLGGVSFRGDETATTRFVFRTPQREASLDRLEGAAKLARVGQRTWELRVTGDSARVFGATFKTGNPGIIYDALGLNGAYISVLAKFFNRKHWTAELQNAKPAMVVINYGTNESVYAEFVDETFEKELRETIQRIRAAVPEASILIMSPMDRGIRNSEGDIVSVPALERLVTIEQRVAADTGVAFFNTFEAMGGSGTMARWYRAEPRMVNADFIHPMPSGAKVVANLLFNALMDGYQRYKTKQMQNSRPHVAQ